MNFAKHPYPIKLNVKPIIFFIGLFIVTMTFGQVQTQKGVSYRYNGKAPRTPLPNVTIECVTANNAVISDSTGSFTLVFNQLKMGDRIGLVTVKKREMMVFNQHAVDEWSIRKEPLTLILCDANEFESQKQELIAIGRREAKARYDRQKAELEAQLQASQIDRAQYEDELNKAWKELDRLHQHLDEYADLFARIDQSEIDPNAQQAMDLFNQGQVDEAIRLFEQGNYLEKLKSDNRAIQQAETMMETAGQVKERAEKEREEHLQSLKAQIAAYKVQNEWEKAGDLLKGLADELNTTETMFEYALFCANQNQHNEGIAYYQRALETRRLQAKDNPQTYEPGLASTLHNLGRLYFYIQRLTECEAAYKEALEIYRRLTKENPQVYEPDLAITLNSLGELYYVIRRLTDSEAAFSEALEIRRRLAKENPQFYETYVATTLNNYGSLYATTRRLSESEAAFMEALEISRRLALDNPQTYESDVAEVLGNLGIFYYYTQRFTEGETSISEALEIYIRLAKGNPQAYEPDVATMLTNLGTIYYTTQRLIESEATLSEALEIRRRLAKENPKAYEPDVATTLNNLGALYSDIQHFTESEAAFMEALEIRTRLANDNPQVYELDMAATLYNLGLLYKNTQRFTESEAFYSESLETYRRLAQGNPQAYEPYVAKMLNELGDLYYTLQRFTENEVSYMEALEIYKRLAKDTPQAYEPKVVETLIGLAFNCILLQKFEKAEQYAREALQIDDSQTIVYTNLAAALLFQGKYDEAEQIFRQYKDELKDDFLQDLNDFEAAGVIPEERKTDVERIRQLLVE